MTPEELAKAKRVEHQLMLDGARQRLVGLRPRFLQVARALHRAQVDNKAFWNRELKSCARVSAAEACQCDPMEVGLRVEYFEMPSSFNGVLVEVWLYAPYEFLQSFCFSYVELQVMSLSGGATLLERSTTNLWKGW